MQSVDDNKLFQFLGEAEVVDKSKLEAVFEASKKNNSTFSKQLLDADLISDENLGRIVADLYGISFIDLGSVKIEDDVLRIVPEKVAKRQKVIVFGRDEKGIHVASSNPESNIFDLIKTKTGSEVIVYYATPKNINKAMSGYAEEMTRAFDAIISENIAEAKTSKNAEPPIIKIVDSLIEYAYIKSASDIHIEPLDEETLVRFRIDGVLHDVMQFPLDLHGQIVTRVKVMASLRTDEHQEPQDGKLVYKTDDEDLDLRVSIVPIVGGEKVVMRLLSEKSRQYSLQDLGFSSEDLAKVEREYKQPHGMILSTGPTGSGKTTTLYAILKQINKRGINIMTIEDPVEYDVENVNQIQVNEKTELTFAKGLRSIVRQDPDVILVGEIRDSETADIAVNSSMTGHLVLSTLHTNDSATALPRLVDMDVEAYLIASTVRVIIAQRLVRKIHTKCRVSMTQDEIKSVISSLDKNLATKYYPDTTKVRMYKGKGCDVCHMTGYLGRVGIFEVLTVDDEVRAAISSKQESNAIRDIAIKNGMRTMLEDGIEKVKAGVTTVEEVLRVSKD